MTIARYEIFRTVLETGGFLKAANELRLTQSAVSQAISSLESEFGLTLLTRGRSGIKLTPNGEKILFHIHQVLNAHEQLLQEVAEMKGIKTGVVRVGTFPSVSINWLPQIIKNFKQKFPHIDIKLMEGNYDDISKWITNGVVDFGFLSLPTDQSFEVIPLKKDKIRCILSDQHPLSHQDTIYFEQLKNEFLIMPKTNIDKDVRKILKQNNIIPSVKYEMEEDQAIIAMVQNNLGMSILPELILYRLPENIRMANLEGDYYRTIGVAATSFKRLSPSSEMFLNEIVQCVKSESF
ncbi:LysR family transcriptional regulator [Siminovitchia sp. 179-K 8D1 HS]|uniref:LysR family transcriptional regulator n=1 Tax=Siminovitchia sp. 179-K 8D1 HS TaxID=3142385 RepID=UPI0039A052D1